MNCRKCCKLFMLLFKRALSMFSGHSSQKQAVRNQHEANEFVILWMFLQGGAYYVNFLYTLAAQNIEDCKWVFRNAQILSSADRSLQAQAVGAHCLHTLSAFGCTVCVVTLSKLVAHNECNLGSFNKGHSCTGALSGCALIGCTIWTVSSRMHPKLILWEANAAVGEGRSLF